MAWQKKTAIALGILMGVSASFIAMIPSGHKTEATIAVIDAKNIEHAATTAIQTASILTEEQKKYALMLLHYKKLSPEILNEAEKDLDKQIRNSQGTDIKIPGGILKYNDTVEHMWKLRLGNLDDIMNGRMTVYDAALAERERDKTLDKTYEQAVVSAAQAMKDSKISQETIQKALDESNKAEGESQLLQAANVIASENANNTTVQNKLLAQLITTVSGDAQRKILKEAAEKAKVDAETQQSKDRLDSVTKESLQKDLATPDNFKFDP